MKSSGWPPPTLSSLVPCYCLSSLIQLSLWTCVLTFCCKAICLSIHLSIYPSICAFILYSSIMHYLPSLWQASLSVPGICSPQGDWGLAGAPSFTMHAGLCESPSHSFSGSPPMAIWVHCSARLTRLQFMSSTSRRGWAHRAGVGAGGKELCWEGRCSPFWTPLLPVGWEAPLICMASWKSFWVFIC